MPRLQDLLQDDGNKDGVFTNSPLNSQNRFFWEEGGLKVDDWI